MRRWRPSYGDFKARSSTPPSSPAFAGLPNQVIPAIAPHLGIAHLNAGGIGMCGRDARKDGLCRLLPPLSCYLCPSFAALRDGPHREMLTSIEAFLNGNQETSDKRILMQLQMCAQQSARCWTNCPKRNNAGTGRRAEQTAIRALLAIAREKFAADLHMDVSVFDQPAWDVSGLRDRGTIIRNPTLYFTQRGTLDQPLPATYGDVVKCWLILDRRSVANMSRRLDAARILWEAIQTRRKGKPEAFVVAEASPRRTSAKRSCSCERVGAIQRRTS